MILFVGQVGTDMKGREAFQEFDFRAIYGTMAKWVIEIDQVDRIPELVSRAWTVALSGRPGPVVVALPEDMLRETSEVLPLSGPVRIADPMPDPEAVADALDTLSGAERPLILFGGTNWTSAGQAALQHFAEASDIPVVAEFRYQDQFDNNSPVFMGEAGVGLVPSVRKLLAEADVILAVNALLGETVTDGYSLLAVPSPQQKLIHVHGASEELGKVYRPTIGIQAGPNAFAKALSPVQSRWADWRAAARRAYEEGFAAPHQPSPVDMVSVSAHLREVLPEDSIVTNGAGNFTVWPNKFLKFGQNMRLLAPQSGSMGYGLPAAIAARIAEPDKRVICFAGDGDFQMTCQELATSVQAGAQPIVLILNNGIYGTIRAHQERNFPARVSGTTMVSPDFVALAKAYGFHAERVETTAQFPDALERAFASSSGAVLDLVIAPDAVTPRQTLSQMRAEATARTEG